ncbi:MAG: hypothetical protein L0Y56_17825, partial [Nitrospira sp.]|nr:hypothetical protein [Nitrospira sp.]
INKRWSIIRNRSKVNSLISQPSDLPISPSPNLPTFSTEPTRQSSNIFTLLALLSLLFAFGTPLYAILFYGLPGWNQLHSPFRWIFPFTLSIAVLAGLGVTYLDVFVSARHAEQGGRGAEEQGSEGRELKLEDLGWFLFWGGLIGVVVMLVALVAPPPFIAVATLVFDRSGLAQNAFANARQFFGYQWPNFFKFFLMIMASGALLRITRCPIFLPSSILHPLSSILYPPSSSSPPPPRTPAPLPIWKPLVITIIALDLLLAGAGFNPAVEPALLHFKPEVVKWLEAQQAEDPFFRINSFDTPGGRGNKVFLANAGMFSNLFDVRGYDSIIPAQYGRLMHLIQENGDLFFNRIGPL